MSEEAMIKHYEKTPKETLINVLVASREQVDKLQKRNKELKQEIERLTKVNQEHQRLNGELREEIELLQNDLESTNNKLSEVSKRCIKTIEYIESYINQFNGVYPTADMRYLDLHKLLEMLKGESNE